MTGLITFALLLAPGFVYLDATKHKIGKVPEVKGIANMSAGVWALCTFGLAIVALPLYLIKRPELITRAAVHPVEPTRRGMKARLLFGLGGLFVIFGVLGEMYGDYRERHPEVARNGTRIEAPRPAAALPY